MCAHYENIKDPKRLERFGLKNPVETGRFDVWPGYEAAMIRRPPELEHCDEAVADLELVTARFGLIPHWATDDTLARHTYNARSETVAQKPSFRDAWRRAQHCVIPAEAIYEPDWRSGKAVSARITRADGEPLGIAGLCSIWKSPAGHWVNSFAMLTVNAERHPLMSQFHKHTDEKRMVVILRDEDYGSWLDCSLVRAPSFMQPTHLELTCT